MKLSSDWIVGFTDGEGCFYVGINPHSSLTVKYQVLPEFRIVQHKRDIVLLQNIRSFFGHGQVVPNKGKDSIIYEYRVRSLETLSKVIVPFFERNELKTMKKFDFLSFRKIVKMMEKGEHLTEEGLRNIIEIKESMNKRKEG